MPPVRPLKLRACILLAPDTIEAIRAEQAPSGGAEPLLAPGWFDCFDAAAIGRALEEGDATAYSLGPTGSDGIDAWLAMYPDGRAYKWHQLSPEFAGALTPRTALAPPPPCD